MSSAAVVLIVAFIFVERRSKEPVLPLRLFKNSIFTMTSIIGFIVGFAMFGAITFLPLYLQVVQRITPTDSGLRLLPMLAGMLLTSITSGQLISHWGRYKVFPIAGTAVMGAGMYLLSLLNVNTSTLAMSIYMFVLGLGLGMVMQVLVIAVQNAVEFRDLGTATSGATFFRSIGGAFGVAVFGEIFANSLNTNLASVLASGSLPPGFDPRAAMSSPQLLQSLPLSVIGGYLHAFALSLHSVFIFAIPFAAFGFVFSWFLKETPLRMTTNVGEMQKGSAAPASVQPEDMSTPARSNEYKKASIALESDHLIQKVEDTLVMIASPENRTAFYEQIASWAKIPLDPTATSLLLQIGRNQPVSPDRLSQILRSKPASLKPALITLFKDRLIANEQNGDGHPVLTTTGSGRQTYDRLVAARQEGLSQILADWSPEQYTDPVEILNKILAAISNDGYHRQLRIQPQGHD